MLNWLNKCILHQSLNLKRVSQQQSQQLSCIKLVHQNKNYEVKASQILHLNQHLTDEINDNIAQ